MNPQEAGSVNVKDLVGYCVYGFNLKAANIYGENVARTQTLLPDVNVYNILVPNNSAVMLDEETRKEWKLSDEHKVISYFSNYILSLNDKVKCIPILDKLLEHRDEYLYFKTDHHWTQLAAYYAYTAFCNTKGIEPAPYDKWEELVFEPYTGEYASFVDIELAPDYVAARIPQGTNDMEYWVNDADDSTLMEGNVISDLRDADEDANKYNCFVCGNRPFSHIHNPAVTDGSSCLVVKDSFGNPVAAFWATVFKEVVQVDPRKLREGT